MIDLSNATYTKNGVLIITDEELETFAYAQLKDFDKNYFKLIHALDVDDFVENYLKCKIIYYKLSLDKSVLGKTAICDGKISVINSKGKLDVMIFLKGSICVDLDACGSEERANFTILHEAGHSLFDTNVNLDILENKSVAQETFLTRNVSLFKVKKRSPEKWMEHHADKYATYLLMPRCFVIKLYQQKHKEFFGSRKRLSKYHPKRTWLLIASIAETLKVSKKAMAYRLKDLGLISEEVFLSLKLNITKKKEASMI